MNKTGNEKSKFLLGAAIAGLMVGAMTPLTACGGGDATAKERNGCNGPNGCGSAAHEGGKKEVNGCSGPNGCNAEHAKKK